MPKYDRLAVYNTMLGSGLVPIFYNPDKEVSKNVASAICDSGAPILEFTNRGDKALAVFDELISFCETKAPSMILGVGSVVDAPTAALYLAHGANFIVGPTLNPEIARLCNRRKVAYVPGTGSVNEISHAEELGAEIVKIFPGDAIGGPGFIKAIKGPMPWTRILVTGGVDSTEESIRKWLNAGASCLGMGSKLIQKELVESGKYAAISELTSQVLNWIQETRK